MSNPLVTVESLSLKNALDSDNPNAINEGRLVVNFYVRGSSNTDRDYLIEGFNKKRNALAAEIDAAVLECQKTNCVSIELLLAVQIKFQKFNQSLQVVLQWANDNAVRVAYIIAGQLRSLQSIRSEFESIK